VATFPPPQARIDRIPCAALPLNRILANDKGGVADGSGEQAGSIALLYSTVLRACLFSAKRGFSICSVVYGDERVVTLPRPIVPELAGVNVAWVSANCWARGCASTSGNGS